MGPGHFSRTCDGLAPSGSSRTCSVPVLNDGWTVGAASRFAVVALVEVFIRASDAGPATFTRFSVSHTVGAPQTKCTDQA
jgi:hypothetical protein